MNLKLLILLVILLGLRFYFFYQNQPQYVDGQNVQLETTLGSEPQIVGSQQIFYANLASSQRVRIITSLFPQFHYGDTVRISGSLNVKVLDDKKTFISMYFPKIEATKSPLAVFSSIRQKLISLFSRTLPLPLSSLMVGIIFGIKEQMPKEFMDNLRISGVVHVIAASGMNVTLIGGFISNFFALFLKRQIALAISILGILFYAILGGLEPSIVRASIMGILVFSAQIMGRQTLALNGLFLAGFVMLFNSPDIATDIGFQLSFAATLGILYIKRLPATISAQLATLPILLANFGIYSIYSILVNGLILWTIPILMVIGGIGALFGLIFMPLGQLIIYFSYPLLIYFEKIVNTFGKIGGVITITSLSWQFIAGYYLILSSILIVLKRKR